MKNNLEILTDNMEYRKHPRSGEDISVIGFGTGYIRDINPQDIRKIFEYGLNQGMNFIDCIRVEDKFTKPIKESIVDFDDEIYTQMHLTGEFVNGEYKRPRDANHMVKVLNDDLKAFGIDYADFGLIHSVDDEKDFKRVIENSVLNQAIKMKEEGLINHVGVTSHNPSVCSKFIEYDEIDFFMVSINPSFDYELKNGKLEFNQERLNFYKECDKNKIALSVMKPYGGGRLLDKNLSPLKTTLSEYQCLKYCLDRPGVVTVLPGISSINQLKTNLNYFNKSKSECDYSFIGNISSNDINQCMYCGHCQPCPNEIEIALISKLYDLSMIGDKLASKHYFKLKHKASECEKCMKCENYCMFNVRIVEKLDKIAKYYGE